MLCIALKSLNSSIRLRSAKGSFETCSVCNNLNDILKNTKLKWSKDQLAIILKIKRLHLQQQAAERQDAKRRKLLAKTSFKGSKCNSVSSVISCFISSGCMQCREPRICIYRDGCIHRVQMSYSKTLAIPKYERRHQKNGQPCGQYKV